MGRRKSKEGIGVHGFYRVRLTEGTGEPGSKIVSESDWNQNVVVNDGFDAYLCKNLAGTSGSQQIGFISLGTVK